MRINMKIRWPEISVTEFLWKLVATVVFIGIIGIFTANHADHESTLQGCAYFVVGACTVVAVVSAITAVVLHIWKYKPRSRRDCVNQGSD